MPQLNLSDDVLDAIRSLRADDDGLQPLEREAEPMPAVEAHEPARHSNVPIGRSDLYNTGRYLRVRV